MSLRLVLICLALLVLVCAPLPASTAPHDQLQFSLAEDATDAEVLATTPPSTPAGNPKQRTFVLLLPLLFPNQFYF